MAFGSFLLGARILGMGIKGRYHLLLGFEVTFFWGIEAKAGGLILPADHSGTSLTRLVTVVAVACPTVF